ncbi:MAG: hypothetical protein H6566_06030 [Lewinellaceae bacterium]|nr:hypothetical protein [Lewinellaceae bacterium]
MRHLGGSDKNGTLVDRASHKAHYVPGAVLALTNLLNNRQDMSKEAEVRDYVFHKVLDDQQNPTVKRVFEDKNWTKTSWTTTPSTRSTAGVTPCGKGQKLTPTSW